MPEHLGEIVTTATTAIITGDPDRVPVLADALGGGPHRVTQRRGFICAEVADTRGTGIPTLVVSTGIGGPATAIVAEELWQVGISSIVRVGTCGSMQRHVRPGDLVISSGSVRDEGTSDQYMPKEIPAVPDPLLLAQLIRTAREADARTHIGVTHCKDSYYSERPFSLPLSQEWSRRWAMLRAVGVLATEMEAAALFAVATVRRFQAAAMLVPVDGTISREQVLRVLQTATRIAAESMIAIATEGSQDS